MARVLVAQVLRARFVDARTAALQGGVECLSAAQLESREGRAAVFSAAAKAGIESLYLVPRSSAHFVDDSSTAKNTIDKCDTSLTPKLVSNSLDICDTPGLTLAAVQAVKRRQTGIGSAERVATRQPPAARQLPPLSAAAIELHRAARGNSLEALRQAIERCLSTHELGSVRSVPDLDAAHPEHGGCALHVAAGPGGSCMAVRALLDAGASIDPRALNGSTPLHWAAGGGDASVVSELLNRGADPTASTYTWTRNTFGKGSGQVPAHWAAESGHVSVLKLLTEGSLSATFFEDERGQLPADLAAKESRDAACTWLQRVADEDYIGIALTLESEAYRVVPIASEASKELSR